MNNQNWLIFLRSLMYRRKALFELLDSDVLNSTEIVVCSSVEKASQIKLENEDGSPQTNVQEAIDVLRLRGKINRETIKEKKQLTNGDSGYQHLFSETSELEVYLPEDPLKEQFFAVINNKKSTEKIIFNGVAIAPSYSHEVLYDGAEWVVL